MLVGHSGAGKTSLRHCLLNKPFVKQHITTVGIDADPAEAKVDVCKAKGWCQHDSELLILNLTYVNNADYLSELLL